MAVKAFRKYAKLLTLPIAFYSFFSFLPFSNANVNKGDLSKLSVSELKTKYEVELHDAVKDEKIYSSEVENLDNILTHYIEAKEEGRFFEIREKKIITGDSLDSLLHNFEEYVVYQYPGLLSKDSSVKYDGFKIIEEDETFKSLINRAYDFAEKISAEYYSSAKKESNLKSQKRLKSLLNKESYEIKDIIIFSNVLKDIEKDFFQTNTKKTPLKTIISSKGEVLYSSNPNVKEVNLSDDELQFVKSSYEAYLEVRDKEFAEAKRYWSPGIAGIIKDGHLGGSNSLHDNLREQVNTAFVIQGYSGVEINEGLFKGSRFPGKFSSKIPAWLIGVPGLFFPFFRNALVAKYTKRDWDFLDGAEGAVQLFLGPVLDFTHPWVFPIRMFAMPFVYEPLRRIFNVYDI